jgi:predicted helicase
LYLDRVLNAEVYGFFNIFPSEESQRENLAICCSDLAYRAEQFSTIIVNGPTDLHVCATLDGHQCLPFFVYDENGVRRENVTDWALSQFREHYKNKKIEKWAIFHYVYGLLHHPGYRDKFADNLKRQLPRIPFAPEFWAFAEAGKKLAALHLDYEQLEPWDLEFVEAAGLPLSYRVEDKLRLSKDKLRLTVNPSLTLAGVPPAALEYRLGNRSTLEWIVDQYQVSTDKRSGISSDPNREDDPEYIVRLVGQVIRVSMETVAIVNALPAYSIETT